MTATGSITAGAGGIGSTGNIVITSSQPSFALRNNASGMNSVTGTVNGNLKWLLALGDGVAEGGSNTGSGFAINRYNDSGAVLDAVLAIPRNTGEVTVNNGFRAIGPGKFAPAGASFGSANAQMMLTYVGGVTQYGFTLRSQNDTTTAIQFVNAAGTANGSISVTAAATAYNTSSSADLKEDLKSFDAGSIIEQTNVYDFKWKSTKERAFGVIAQQAVEVYPLAVTHSKQDGSDEEFWGVDYSKYVPVILQELKALRARVAELEGTTGVKPG
jgi:hypothetical protein